MNASSRLKQDIFPMTRQVEVRHLAARIIAAPECTSSGTLLVHKPKWQRDQQVPLMGYAPGGSSGLLDDEVHQSVCLNMRGKSISSPSWSKEKAVRPIAPRASA